MSPSIRIVDLASATLARPVFFFAAALAATVVRPPEALAQASRQPAASSTVAGDWAGQFLGTVFRFEFRKVGVKWSGRSRSDKYGKWFDLKNVSVAGGNVRFAFPAQPPIVVSLKASGTNMLAGAADVAAGNGAGASRIPLTLHRSAGAK